MSIIADLGHYALVLLKLRPTLVLTTPKQKNKVGRSGQNVEML